MLELYKDLPMRFERNDDGVLEMILDGPNLNAVDSRVHAALPYVWKTIDADPETRVVIVRGAGRAFSAGGSFDMLEEQIASHAMNMRIMNESRDLFYNIINCSKPIISAIHGA